MVAFKADTFTDRVLAVMRNSFLPSHNGLALAFVEGWPVAEGRFGVSSVAAAPDCGAACA